MRAHPTARTVHAVRTATAIRATGATQTHQRGLTLIEFMVSIVIGMLMIAAMATLIANQSTNRAEVDRSGKMIENGRYAIQTMASDIQLAGYWGEYAKEPTVPGAVPDPCTLSLDQDKAMGLPIQGYDAPATLPTDLAVCVKNHQPGTDVIVVRHLDPDSSDVETAGEVDLAKLTANQLYVQTGLDSGDLKALPEYGNNSSSFTYKKKDGTHLAKIRKYVLHIYYISKCSVPDAGGSCTNADGGTPIPTLKRVDLGGPSTTTVTIAEGIENLQIDYGLDSDNDGMPNGADSTGSAFAVGDWANVMSVKIHLLARGVDATPGFADTKTYALGAAGAASAANDGYRRHLFVQSVRLVNSSGRRAS